MAETMKGLKRTHRCGELSSANIGETVTVMGWVQKQRNKGGIIFVDLRDRAGILQVIFEESDCGSENFEKAAKLRSEFVVAVVGRVEKRAAASNENLATGDIEVRAEQIRILSEAETPPFPVEADTKTKEDLRLKYRYLEVRLPQPSESTWMRKASLKLKLPCSASQHRKAPETTWFPAVCIRVSSMHFPSLRRFSSSF